MDGGTWGTFEIDPAALPKHIDTTYEYEDKNGDIVQQTHKQCYELTGDTLRIGGSQVFGQYPPEISEQISSVTTLSRWQGERPTTKQASGIQPIENAVLGTVTWDDNLNYWEAKLELFSNHQVNVSITPADEDDAAAIAAGAELVEWVRQNERSAREYAAGQMLESAEDWRDEDDEPNEITAESFAERIVLESITVEEDGGANLWYNDDQIFAGHVIVVSLNTVREFSDAEIMG